MFDLAGDPGAVRRAFQADPTLGPLVRLHPGLRVPSCWDPFELSVRAIVGQQVSVRAATTMMGRIVARLGRRMDDGRYVFPSPAVVAAASASDLGVTRARADAIRALAREITSGRLSLGAGADAATTVRALTALPGIGEWTAQYIAMRGLGDPDAFPAADIGLRLAAGNGRHLTEAELAGMAERWRPWRAYAAMHLWQSLLEPRS
jgi:AraC family transcriptional regulator of adaptative response / DNA-3-methyladenine glycosylase II